MMAALMAARSGVKVRLLEGNPPHRTGAKILVSGGTRCNVTNEYVAPSRFHGGTAQFIGRVLRSYSLQDTLRFFQEIGVPLKLEETGKFFPVTDSARTVLQALLATVEASGAKLTYEADVLDVAPGAEGWVVTTAGETIHSRAVVLCTGGLALPKTGSDGRGYRFATQRGHTLVRTTPALTPLLSGPKPHAGLSGITLPVRLKLSAGRTLAAYDGSFLFTHVGYSGPAALNLSRHVARERWQNPEANVTLRLLPQVGEGEEGIWWQNFQRDNSRRTFYNALCDLLPARVAENVCRTAALGPQHLVGKLNKGELLAARTALLDMPLPVDAVADYVKAETTAGGIALEEMEAASMMSRLAPGLFFAGEMCDVDGWLGGYNFQWAWSSGTVAGRGAARYVKKSAPSLA